MPYPHYQAMAKAKREKEKRHAEEVLKGVYGGGGYGRKVKVEGRRVWKESEGGGEGGFSYRIFFVGGGGTSCAFHQQYNMHFGKFLRVPLSWS